MTYFTQIDDTALFLLCAAPGEPVQRNLHSRADNIQGLARRMVGVRTGRLRASISTEIIPGPRGVPGVQIGSRVNYALLHHSGTRPHVILPHLRQRLRFKVGGRIVYATQVLHPGTRPNPYLTIPLQRYGRG